MTRRRAFATWLLLAVAIFVCPALVRLVDQYVGFVASPANAAHDLAMLAWGACVYVAAQVLIASWQECRRGP